MPTSTPYIELPDDEFSLQDDWKELVDNTAPGGGATLSNDGQEATLVGFVPWNMQRSAARYFLGYNYTEQVGGVYVMRREQPARHPVFPWLRASTIGFSPYVVKSNPDATNDAPKISSVFEAALYTSYYEKVIATVRYRNYRCNFYDDAEITAAANEWQRNTVFDAIPKIEALSADGGLATLQFAETASGGPSITPPVDKVPVPLFTLMAKFGLRITWLNVPIEYIGGDNYYAFPTQILNCLGHVNDATWLDGIPAGTAFLEAVGIQEKTAPIAANSLTEPIRYLDLVLDVSYFNPEKGVSGSSYRGHNLMPWRADGKWYYASRDGTAPGRPLFQPVDFDQIFEGVPV